MVSNTKLYSRLDALEAELDALFLPHLKNAAMGENQLIFCVKAFNPFRELKRKTDKVTEEAVDLGSHIISLREKLGEPTKGSLAERICWYCREWSKTKKSDGGDLAKRLMMEINGK